MDSEEKQGGRIRTAQRCFDFISTMEACRMTGVGFTGPKFTWCNKRSPNKRIWKRLDRTDHKEFLDIVQESWNMDITGNAMWKLQCKLKTLKLEELDLLHNTGQSREDLNKGHVEYIKWINMQDSIYRQKAHIKWFKEGDCNSKFFHSILRIRRNKLSIHRIKNHQGNWIQGEERIIKAAIKHFKSMFNLDQPTTDQSLMNCIPSLINAEDNKLLDRMPDEEEIKEAIFSMSLTSAAGPNGYNGKFFQSILIATPSHL
ncbi:hypothetical protein KY290_013528 [Solanum tuberosum]|uniref:Uncharacterized protein n=1 Tax=Solanum tuberosum TaxID=4113 RepID=A0ABQ7VPS3_SOLTU|nr:hypothetical protein KY285_012992 [Solanum tuberosum]KAH0769547.1 hypothetical protein KY290_013528 [Solanum tuberosum]